MSEPNQDNGTSPAAPPSGPAAPPTAPQGWGPGYGQAPGYGQGEPPVPSPGGYGQPQYGPPQYGQPQYGQPQYGEPSGYRPAPLQRGIVPLRPLSLGEIFDGGFRSIRANPRVMFGVSAVVVTISVLIQTVVQWYSLGPFSDLLTMDATGVPSDAQADELLGDFAGIWSGQVLAGILTLVVTTMLTGLLIISVSRSVIGQQVSLADAWARARPQLWRLLGLTLLVISVMLSVPVLWVAALVGLFAIEQYGLAAAVVFVGGVGMLVWLAWISVRTLLATPALMLEDQRLIAGFKRGWALSKGSFWRLFGIYLLTTLMVATVAYLIIGPVTIGAMILTSDGMTDMGYITDPLYLAITAVGTVVATVLTTPFTAAVVALLYIDTRMRREGLDVELTRAAEAAANEAAGGAKG